MLSHFQQSLSRMKFFINRKTVTKRSLRALFTLWAQHLTAVSYTTKSIFVIFKKYTIRP